MTDEELPSSDNVACYARPKHIDDQESGRVNGGAFVWNGKGKGLSVNWLEYFRCLSKSEQLDKVRELIHQDMGTTGRLAEFNVGAAVQHISIVLLEEPRFLHRPSPPEPDRHPKADPTHCELVGLPSRSDDPRLASKIGDLIAECVSASHATKIATSR